MTETVVNKPCVHCECREQKAKNPICLCNIHWSACDQCCESVANYGGCELCSLLFQYPPKKIINIECARISKS